MAAGKSTSFPLVRGRTMRVVKLNGCGQPITDPAKSAMAVTSGFVSVALTANINEPEAIEVKNADGQTCVRDAGTAEFTGYNVDITFCNVMPCVFSMLTGQDVMTGYKNGTDDTDPEPVIGFTMDSARKASDSAFSLEVWARSPSPSGCDDSGNVITVDPDADPSGYLVLPFLKAGVIGDLTIENGAVSFVVSGAVSQDGNQWGKGPFPVLTENTGTKAAPQYTPAKLAKPLTKTDHLGVFYTTLKPPAETDGCVPFVAA
jgi:hypothetical protein